MYVNCNICWSSHKTTILLIQSLFSFYVSFFSPFLISTEYFIFWIKNKLDSEIIAIFSSYSNSIMVLDGKLKNTTAEKKLDINGEHYDYLIPLWANDIDSSIYFHYRFLYRFLSRSSHGMMYCARNMTTFVNWVTSGNFFQCGLLIDYRNSLHN